MNNSFLKQYNKLIASFYLHFKISKKNLHVYNPIFVFCFMKKESWRLTLWFENHYKELGYWFTVLTYCLLLTMFFISFNPKLPLRLPHGPQLAASAAEEGEQASRRLAGELVLRNMQQWAACCQGDNWEEVSHPPGAGGDTRDVSQKTWHLSPTLWRPVPWSGGNCGSRLPGFISGSFIYYLCDLQKAAWPVCAGGLRITKWRGEAALTSWGLGSTACGECHVTHGKHSEQCLPRNWLLPSSALTSHQIRGRGAGAGVQTYEEVRSGGSVGASGVAQGGCITRQRKRWDAYRQVRSGAKAQSVVSGGRIGLCKEHPPTSFTARKGKLGRGWEWHEAGNVTWQARHNAGVQEEPGRMLRPPRLFWWRLIAVMPFP